MNNYNIFYLVLVQIWDSRSNGYFQLFEKQSETINVRLRTQGSQTIPNIEA